MRLFALALAVPYLAYRVATRELTVSVEVDRRLPSIAGTLSGMEDSTESTPVGTYEISIRVELGDYTFATEYSHPGMPDQDTIVGLKDEAVNIFRALYDQEPDEIGVWMTYYSPDQREPELEVIRLPR